MVKTKSLSLVFYSLTSNAHAFDSKPTFESKALALELLLGETMILTVPIVLKNINNLKFHPKLILLTLLCLIIALSSCTSHEEQMRQYKEQAIKKAWEQERELVSFADIGTREWTVAEKKELLETGRISGYEGRYINKKIEDNPRLATNADNVVFAKVDETYLPKELLQNASLRSYTIAYEENKYSLWGGFILTILILTVAFQKKRGIIVYPAIAGAVLGAVRMGIISGGSIKAIIAGLASGLIIGTLAGIFIFLIVISGGVG